MINRAAELWTKHTDALRRSHAFQWKALKKQLPVLVLVDAAIQPWIEQGNDAYVNTTNWGTVIVGVSLREDQGLRDVVPLIRAIRAIDGVTKGGKPGDNDGARVYFYRLEGVPISIVANVMDGGVCHIVPDLDAEPVYPTKIVCDD